MLNLQIFLYFHIYCNRIKIGIFFFSGQKLWTTIKQGQCYDTAYVELALRYNRANETELLPCEVEVTL